MSGYRVSFLESTKIGKNKVPLNSKLAKNEIDKICLLFKDNFNIQNWLWKFKFQEFEVPGAMSIGKLHEFLTE